MNKFIVLVILCFICFLVFAATGRSIPVTLVDGTKTTMFVLSEYEQKHGVQLIECREILSRKKKFIHTVCLSKYRDKTVTFIMDSRLNENSRTI